MEMTEDELLIKSLKNILAEQKQLLSEVSGSDEFSRTISSDYEKKISMLERILSKATDLDSFYDELEEDEFVFAVDMLQDYFDYFVVDGTSDASLKETEAEYAELADLLFSFYDDDEEEDYSDEDEDVDDDFEGEEE